MDFFDRLVAVSFAGLTTTDIDPMRDGFRGSFSRELKTPEQLLSFMNLAWDPQRVIDLAQGLIINALPKAFLPEGPIWVEMRVHRGGETEEEDEDPTRPIMGVWIEDERVLNAKNDLGTAMLFVDRRGIEYALEEMIDWLGAPAGTEQPIVFTIEDAGKRIQRAQMCGHVVLPVGMSTPTDDTTVAIIRGDRMELLVGSAHEDSVIMLEMPSFPRYLLTSMERELLLGDQVSEVYGRHR